KLFIWSWIWSDGSNSSYRDWNTGEPNNKESEICIQLQGKNGYRWADVACHWPNPFVCYDALCNRSFCGTRQFHVVNYNKSWTEAQKYCRENFTDLATIENQEEMNAVKAAINGSSGLFWIGLKIYTSWIWSDGSNSSYRNWSIGKPDNLVGDNCVQLLNESEYSWNDAGCIWGSPFICYKGE
uniref:C-type lectin domain-containing protein n=1 Tax=Astyanax mexicanus TaxID=7994 RepID=A0A8B9JHP7_ASTMX